MTLKGIKWVGIDFGQCLMSPSSLRNPHMFGDIGKLLGKQEMIPVWIDRMRRLKEKYKTYTLVKEKNREEILTFVLDGDREAYELFGQKEPELLSMAPGLLEFLLWLNGQGIRPSVVSELKKTLGPVGTDMITKFLVTKGILRHFNYFITPHGKMDLATGEKFKRYEGTSKESGTLYDELLKELEGEGIRPGECVMIGDKRSTDIIPPKKRGFITIQYTGHVDEGPCEQSDYYAKTFLEVKEILERLYLG